MIKFVSNTATAGLMLALFLSSAAAQGSKEINTWISEIETRRADLDKLFQLNAVRGLFKSKLRKTDFANKISDIDGSAGRLGGELFLVWSNMRTEYNDAAGNLKAWNRAIEENRIPLGKAKVLLRPRMAAFKGFDENYKRAMMNAVERRVKAERYYILAFEDVTGNSLHSFYLHKYSTEISQTELLHYRFLYLKDFQFIPLPPKGDGYADIELNRDVIDTLKSLMADPEAAKNVRHETLMGALILLETLDDPTLADMHAALLGLRLRLEAANLNLTDALARLQSAVGTSQESELRYAMSLGLVETSLDLIPEFIATSADRRGALSKIAGFYRNSLQLIEDKDAPFGTPSTRLRMATMADALLRLPDIAAELKNGNPDAQELLKFTNDAGRAASRISSPLGPYLTQAGAVSGILETTRGGFLSAASALNALSDHMLGKPGSEARLEAAIAETETALSAGTYVRNISIGALESTAWKTPIVRGILGLFE